MSYPTYNVSLEQQRWWLPLLLTLGTLAMESWQLWHRADVPTIEPGDCWALCEWSGAPVQVWAGSSCTCGPARPR